MNYLDFPRVGERMYREVLENGLHVFVFPKPEQMHWIRERMEIDAPAWRGYVENEAAKFYGTDKT